MVDCDDFKSINDRFGHSRGDSVIRELGSLIENTVRPTDVAGRIGGDEFLVLYPESRVHEALAAAERIRSRIRGSEFLHDGETFRLTASVGVTPVPPAATSIDEVLPLLGMALKASKTNGKNCVRTLLADRGLVLGATQCQPMRAVGSIRPHQQPIIDLTTGDAIAFEMLTRGPRGPCELPLDMFQAAHEQGILARIDLACLAECASAAAKIDGDVRIHLNLYPSTIESVQPELIVEAIAPLLPSRVCIELSEQQLIGSHDRIVERIEALRTSGLRFAVDDVGFGRSSLESLIMLEPEVVKIDRALVSGIASDSTKRRRLTRLVGAIGHLRQECIAEGVEVPEDADALRSIGVSFAQGYFLGRPYEVSHDAMESTE